MRLLALPFAIFAVTIINVANAAKPPNCKNGQVVCRGICQNLNDNPDNCGRCFNQCKSNEICSGTTCTLYCPHGVACNGVCCTAGQTCIGGTCCSNSCGTGTSATCCTTGQSCIGGSCITQACSNPSTCNSGGSVNYNQCSTESCYCFPSVSEGDQCAAVIDCTGFTCTTDAQCVAEDGPGSFCTTLDCDLCGNGANPPPYPRVCVQGDGCPGAMKARDLFGRHGTVLSLQGGPRLIV